MSQNDPSASIISDPRLALYAASSAPAWLWSLDGARILWANAAGAKVFGAHDGGDLVARPIGPADPHRRQVNQIAGRLPLSGAARLERLRGFGAALGGLMTCACSRLALADGTIGILVATAQTAARAPAAKVQTGMTATPVDAAASSASLPTPENTHGLESEPVAVSAPDEGLSASESSKELPITPAEVFEPASAAEPSIDEPAGEDRQAEAHAVEGPSVEASSIEESSRAEIEELPAFVAPAPEAIAEDTPELLNAVSPLAEQPPSAPSDLAHAPTTPSSGPFNDDALLGRRRHPLRFMWQMNEDGRFSFGSDEFTRLIGAQTAAAFGRLWSEIAGEFGLDPGGRVASAVATRGTWSGLIVNWPVDGSGARLPVEMSGLPIYDHERRFTGYRGFGICRDLDGLTRLAAQRRHDTLFGPQQSTEAADAPPAHETPQSPHATLMTEPPALSDPDISPQIEPDQTVETPPNVVPFRSAQEPKPPSLTAVENSAFNEIARQLSARLEGESNSAENAEVENAEAAAGAVAAEPEPSDALVADSASAPSLQPDAAPARSHGAQTAQIFDHLPVGVLVYRLDQLIYANRAFFERTGYGSLDELTQAGGLDALYVESGAPPTGDTTDDGSLVVISTARSAASHARLHTIDWDGESTQALIFSAASQPKAAAPQPPDAPAQDDPIQAEELATILETTAEGILLFDASGRITSCNRSSEALFSLSGSAIGERNLIDLFAPESQRAIADYLEGVKTANGASLLEHGRSALGRAPDGGTLPLSVTIGRTRPEGTRYFALLRDQSPPRPSDSDLLAARRSTDRLANAKADVLARISHEVRTPLNAIIGFAEVMIEERFGALGNERYADYMKDIRASGERVIAIIDDMLDLSRIESGKLDLAFTNQDINALIEQCVGVMQPQANRERIIIRTSLTHALPSVRADAHALRQIALNLIGSSIHLANAGGQVIVSTAMTDHGEVVLRVRDTGHGLNDNEIAAALAPFRTPAASDHLPSETSANLSLTKALVEANRAVFHIKSAPHTGTLIEVVFAKATVQAV